MCVSINMCNALQSLSSSLFDVASASLFSVRNSDKRIACDEEFSDSEDEGEGGRKNVANYKKAKRAKTEEDKEEEEKKGRHNMETLSILGLFGVARPAVCDRNVPGEQHFTFHHRILFL